MSKQAISTFVQVPRGIHVTADIFAYDEYELRQIIAAQHPDMVWSISSTGENIMGRHPLGDNDRYSPLVTIFLMKRLEGRAAELLPSC